MSDNWQWKRVCKTLCKSGKFETGEGTCSLICLGQLGDARAKGCSHTEDIHGKLASQILKALNS